MVSITSNTDSTHLIMDSNTDAEMKWLQSLHLKHVTKVFRQNLCILQGSQARFPAHVHLTLDTSSGVYMRCSWFILCHITIHEPRQIHERSIGLIRILHQKSLANGITKFFKSYLLWKPSRCSLIQQAFQTLHDRYNPTKRIQGARWNGGNTHIS